jgi:hypothetical protein
MAEQNVADPMMPVAAVKVLKAMDAEKFAGLTSQTVYSWIKQKLIPTTGRNMVTVEDLIDASDKAIERKAEREKAKAEKAAKEKELAEQAKALAKVAAEKAVAEKANPPATEPLEIKKDEEAVLQEQLNESVKQKALEGVRNAGKPMQHAGKK